MTEPTPRFSVCTPGEPAEDSRATVTAWFAYVSADGDQRTKYPEWAALAGTLYPQIGAIS
jgi:hypothetical protein